MAELIATGTTQVDSADFIVAAGSPKALYFKAADGDRFDQAQFLLQHKTPAAAYVTVQQLDGNNIAALGNIVGAGTFRVRRLAGPNAVGMDIE